MEQMAVVPEKDLSDKDEDNKYEPFTFELKPDLHYVPDKTEHEHGSSNSSSSSSTDSEDDDDFIQLDTISLADSFPNPYPNNNDSNTISRKNSNPDEFLFVPTSQPVFSTQPVELIDYSDKPAAQDATRIPSSIFTTHSTVPEEWSIASAESLFSLKLSKSSFSLENSNFNGLLPDSPAPTTPGSAISMVSDVSLEGFGGPLLVPEKTIEEANDEVVKETGVVSETDAARLVNVSDANVHQSGSISSIQSFAFPVLTGHEKTESTKAIPQAQQQPQPQLESPLDLTTPSISPDAEPESDTESEPGTAVPPSSNSYQLTQPPETQVMAAPSKEQPSEIDSGATTNARPDATKASKSTSTSNTGSFCSCCSSFNS